MERALRYENGEYRAMKLLGLAEAIRTADEALKERMFGQDERQAW